MTTAELDRFRCVDGGAARRVWRRVPVRFTLRCRRLARAGFDEAVEAVDLSPGGIRFRARPGLITGDVVMLSVSVDGIEVGFKGLVVGAGTNGDGATAEAHVAFTGLGRDASDNLARLLRLHDLGTRAPAQLVD